jgi:hypothetical protein
MFDGAEVLPLDLLEDYRIAMEDEPLEAAELMVPVTRGQFWQLKKDMIPQKDPGLYVVRRPYSKEYGLVLKREILNEGV